MKYSKLGVSDLNVSRVGLGGLQFGTPGLSIGDEAGMKEVINTALDSGINFIDTAEIYAAGGSERVIGETVKERGDRDDLIIATKVFPEHMRYDDVIKAANASLKRLQTDVIDLYQVHHPNPIVPVAETMKAMDYLLREGKIRYVGVSNFDAAQTQRAIDSLKNGEIVSNQLEYSIIVRDVEKELLPYLREIGIATIAYSPLASGLLTGKYDEDTELPEDDRRARFPLFGKKENRRRVSALVHVMGEVAKAHDAKVPQVALNWLLKFDDVFPIPGAKTPSQAMSNANAAEWMMTEEEWERIAQASEKLELDLLFDFG